MPRWHECFQAKSLQKRAKFLGTFLLSRCSFFLKKESAHAQASGDASAAPKPLQRHRDCPPYCTMKQITARGSAKAEYVTIDRNETTIATASDRNIATIVTLVIAPTIVAHDAHEDK
jgi:hypothetical protein